MSTLQSTKSILIVESQNDRAFIAILLQELGIDAELDVIVEHLHKFKDELGQERRGKEALGSKLKSFKRDLEKKYPNVEKFGVILDFDYPTQWDFKQNLALVNDAFGAAFGTSSTLFSKELEFVKIDDSLQAACFFNKDSSGNGNLDSLLLEIRKDPNKKVPYADCLEQWRDCVNDSTSALKVNENTYAKIWLGNFLRAHAKALGRDSKNILSDFEEKQSEVINKVGASVFDLKHAVLTPLRDFLLLFKNTATEPK
jgi:hypothetical protein